MGKVRFRIPIYNGADRIGYRCGERLPFHHSDYQVCYCNKPEGHTGKHRCSICGAEFQMMERKE